MSAASPTTEDLKRWRRLIALAREAADGAPSVLPGGMRDQVVECRKRTVAPGVLTPANPFIRLVRLCDRWVQATTAKRRDMAAEMISAAEAAQQALDALMGERPDGAPARRERKDIDG